MEALATYTQPFFAWLLETTVIASVVICLILAAQKLLGRRLGPRWCHALWLVLLLRMVLPWTPPSPVSLFNLIPASIQRHQPQANSHAIGPEDRYGPVEASKATESRTTSTLGPAEAAPLTVSSRSEGVTKADRPSASAFPSMRRLLPFLWLAGAIVLGGYLLASSFALWRIVKREQPLVNQPILELFETCKAQMGVQTIVALVPNDQVRTAALFGFVRPRLLLPREMIETVSPQELRYVFLHELAHLKRYDIYLGWLASLLQVLHWFNPLIWLAFHQMRADRELACDALVLTRTHQAESHQYGQTMVTLLGRFSQSRPLPAMAGILESKSQLKRRIVMIAKFKNNSYQWSPLAVLLIVAIGCTSLFDRRQTASANAAAVESGPAMTLRRVQPEEGDCANVSPDGKYLCDVDNSDAGAGNLFIRELSTGRRWAVTDKKSWEDSHECAEEAAISTDSRRVAYLWWNDTSDLPSLYVVNLDGSDRKLLCKDIYAMPRDWSADGSKILAILYGPPHRMVWISASDGSIQQIKDIGKEYPGKFDISPDGRFLAYDLPQAEDTKMRDVFLFDLQENREIRLAEHPADDRLLGWTPDGRSVLFASNRSDKWDAWLLGVSDGMPAGPPRLVKANIGDVGAVGFASNGDYYFSIYDLRENVYVARFDLTDGTLLSPPARLLPTDKSDLPVWSPDGQHLAYACSRGDKKPSIKIWSLASGQGREIALRLPPRLHFWAPDGRSLLLSGFLDEEWAHAVYSLDLETGEHSELFRHEDMFIPAAQWFPDGKRILYHGRRDPIGGTEKLGYLMMRDMDSGEEREITSGVFPGLGDRFWALSPDGRQLAVQFKGDGSKIRIFSTETDEVREVLAGELATKVHRIIWAPDGKTLMLRVLDLSASRKSEIWRIAADGGNPEKLSELDIPEYVTEMRIDPTGRQIALQAITNLHELWVMENFLPEAPATREPAPQPAFRKVQIPYDAFRLRPDAPLSPDGKSIALVLESKLWVMPRASALGPDLPGAPTLLDTGDIEVSWGGETWSGDGRWIAFHDKDQWNEEEKRWGTRRVYVISVEGGKPKEVYENWRYGDWLVNYRMSLSPHGKTLAFSSVDDNEQHIYTIPVDGGVPKRLVEAPAREPVFSPDGKRVAYVADKDRGARGGGLWVVSADGGAPRLIADAGHATSPVWSPDGRMIAFLDREQAKQISIIPIGEDGEPAGERITISCPEGIDSVSRLTGWTPDNKIGTIFHGDPQYGLYTLPATGGIVTLVRHGGELLMQPRWSPDGKRIIVTVAAGEGRDGWLHYGLASVSAEGGEISTIPVRADTQITKLSYGGGNHVSPDGQTIVFAGRRAGQKALRFNHIWTIDIEGGEPKQLTTAPAPLTHWFPCWSPDGKAIAFIRCKNDPIESTGTDTGIFIIPADGGEPRQLTRKSDMVHAYIAWSPDGKWLSYFSFDKENPRSKVVLKVVPAEGGASRVVGELEQGFDIRMESAWSPDSKRIAFIGTDYKVIKIISLDDGSIVDVDPHLADTHIYHLDWSRDGNGLVFPGSQGVGLEFWTIENFLPREVGK